MLQQERKNKGGREKGREGGRRERGRKRGKKEKKRKEGRRGGRKKAQVKSSLSIKLRALSRLFILNPKTARLPRWVTAGPSSWAET